MADTVAFRILLVLSSFMVLPVLALGLIFSPLFFMSLPDAGALAFFLLSIGGAVGMVGWLRARWGARTPDRHNVELTLVLLGIGIATALAVGGLVAYAATTAMWTPWRGSYPPLLVAIAFAIAHGVWIVSGIAWIERLMFSYAVRTGRTFDAIPFALLLVALGLALAVVLAAAALT
jgi:hypothetical protein